MNGLHLFIDSSNVFIEAQRVARARYNYDDFLVPRLRISYGNLLDFVKDGRKLMEAVLVGSRPPSNDNLWNKLKTLNIEPRIFDRSLFTNREKSVDAEMINAIRDTLDDNPHPGTIALVAGDEDYLTTLERCLKKGWSVETYFWSQCSSKLKKLNNAKFIELDQVFKKLTFVEKERI
ncbi:MAG: NYN domain-containing protein [Endomicrobiia bacterium]|nr:NYN domain-containing protein [Endomicrobiia bacterium]